MPRAKCDQVIEHRVSLGTYERAELKKMVKAEKVKDYSQAAAMFTPIIGMAAIGGGVAFAGYHLAQAIGGLCGGGVPPLELGDTLDDGSKVTIGELFWGRKTHTYTNDDGTQTQINNPLHGVGGFGAAGSFAINLGRAVGVRLR